MMREATRIGVRAHRAAEAAFRAGASEFDIHLAYCSAARQDAAELPYGNIVALNEHAAVLHYMNDQNTATAKRLKTLTQTKNTRATTAVSMSKVSNAQNTRRLATKK